MNIQDALSLTHPLFRFGVPHERPRIIPIRTNAHFIAFDRITIGPRYVMARIDDTTDDKVVERHDDFISEFTLPPELRTKSSDYEQWNREHPEFPVDQGHQAGSQIRRSNRTVQSDIDSLAGVCPETPALNRHVKGPLENRIVARATQYVDVYWVAGPWFMTDNPFEQKRLPNGQWIPDGFFISTLWRPGHSRIECWSWLMQNDTSREQTDLRTASLEQIEMLTGLVLWDRINDTDIPRDEIPSGDWWK